MIKNKILKFIFVGTLIFLLNGCVSLFMPQAIKEEKTMGEAFIKSYPQSFSDIS